MDRLTDILQDIYRLEPDLKGEDATVRAVVSELISTKPTVVPDAAFVARLRAELTGAKAAAAHPVRSPWFFYAAPVGVFALLLLMLVPQYVTSPTKSADTEGTEGVPAVAPEATAVPMFMTAPTGERADVPVGSGASMKSMGGTEGSLPAGGADMSLMAMPVSDEPVSSLSVQAQFPGATVEIEAVYATVPALIVVYRGDTVIGVSLPVAPGIMTEATIPLTSPAVVGEELAMVLYADNGDGIFTPGTDLMVIDSFGNPIKQSVTVIRRR